MRKLFLDAIWVWLAFFVLAVLNGLLRDALYVPEWGDIGGRIAGTLILLAMMLIAMYVFLHYHADALSRPRLVAIGILWLGLSLFFEFAVTRWVMEQSWDQIMAHYNVMSGRFHLLVRLAELAGPILLGSRLLPGPEEAPAGAPGETPHPTVQDGPPAGSGGGL